MEARKDEQVEHFQGSETTLHETMTDTCHYTCVQNHRMDTTKNDPDINNGLYVQKLRQGLWAQAAWVQIPARTPKGHAIGAKLLHFSGSQFRHL